MKVGMLVTAKAWYMTRRVYGRIVSIGRRDKKGFVAVLGSFGLEEFHVKSVKVVPK